MQKANVIEEQNQLHSARMKKGLFVAFSLGIAAIVLIMAFTFDVTTIDALLKIHPAYLGLAVGAVVVSWFFSALAFYILTRIIRAPISLSASTRVYLTGSFFGFITPFSSGLLPTQIYVLAKENLAPGQATAVASARAMTSSWLLAALGATILVAFRSALPGAVGTNLLIGVIAVAAAWSAIVLYFIKRPDNAKRLVAHVLRGRVASYLMRQEARERTEAKLDSEIDHLSLNLKDLLAPRNYPALALVIAAEIVAWIALFSVLPLVLFGLGWEGNLATLVFRMFLLFCLAPASPTPGGSGAVELGFTMMLYNVVPSHIIGLVVLIWRALTYYLTLLAGSVVALRLLARTRLAQAGAAD